MDGSTPKMWPSEAHTGQVRTTGPELPVLSYKGEALSWKGLSLGSSPTAQIMEGCRKGADVGQWQNHLCPSVSL